MINSPTVDGVHVWLYDQENFAQAEVAAQLHLHMLIPNQYASLTYWDVQTL